MRRLRRHLHSFLRLQPGKPALWTGVRAAMAVTVPFVGATLLGAPEAGWTGLSGLLVTLADRGGSYRNRARVMGSVAMLGALVGALAAPAGGRLAVDVVLLLVGVTAASFARCFGESAGATGEKLAVIFVASLGAKAVGFEPAAWRGGALLAGGAWAMFQALVLWPIHPYRPARHAVAKLYQALATAGHDLALLARTGAGPETWAAEIARHSPIRHSVEEARQTLAAIRVGQEDHPPRSEHLLVLVESSEPTIAILLALATAMEAASSDEKLLPVRQEVARVCDAFAQISRRVAATARSPERNPPRYWPNAATPEAMEVPSEQRAELPPSVLELLARLKRFAVAAHRTAEEMRLGRPPPPDVPRPLALEPARATPWLEPVRASLRRDSLVLRHAARAGVVASLALVITRAFHLGEAFWVVLCAIGILQPYSSSTEERALQRVGGTLLGGTLAAVLAGGIHSPLALIAVIGLLTAVSVSLLPLNFAAFQMLLTPDFLLVATLSTGDWTVAENRAVGVLIACALALTATWWLWPAPERQRFPDAVANALRADGDYLRQVARAKSGTEPEVSAARRTFGLAMLEAEASFERLSGEYRGPAHRLEHALALLTYSRRLAASVTALGEQPPQARASEVVEEVAQEAGGALDALADSLQRGRAPPPLPRLPVPVEGDDPVSGGLVERVPRQLEVLRGAVERICLEGLGPPRVLFGR